MSDIVDKVRELSRIKADIAKLNDRRKELEAYFLERGGDDVVDTKFKSTVYADPDSQAAVTYTEAQALTIVYPHFRISLRKPSKPRSSRRTRILSACSSECSPGITPGQRRRR